MDIPKGETPDFGDPKSSDPASNGAAIIPPKVASVARSNSHATEWRVEVDLPEPLIVTGAELDAIEAYFGDLIEDCMTKIGKRRP
jgi:hypothetical protein